MRGAAVSGVFLLASWRVGFSLFLWIATIFLILLIFKCLKSLALAIKDQGLAILGSGPPSPRGRARDQVYTVAGHRSASRPDRRTHRPRTGQARPPTQAEVEYIPPNTPMQTPPLEPPPYSSISGDRSEDPPPAYDTLYPAKESQQGIPPV